MSDLPNLSLTVASRALASGELCPVEYTDALLSRIAACDHVCHAMLDVEQETALARARSLKASRKKDCPPALFGVPFLVKDIIDVEGRVTTCQSQSERKAPAMRSADCVRRLIACGGIYLGKTAMNELALGGVDFDAPWPPVRNPWNPAFTPGSSSGGSGAAVAAGYAPLALGTDTGGSIRSPATMNGVVGLKPTFARLSTKGVLPLAPSMDTVGPVVRRAEDLGLVFNCLSGGGQEIAALPAAPKLARLDHLWREELFAHADVEEAFDAAMEDLASAGAEIGHRRTASMATFNAIGWMTLFAEAFQVHKSRIVGNPRRFGKSTLERLLRGAHVTVGEYISAQHLRKSLTESLDNCLDGVDALVLPTSARPSCELENPQAMTALDAASTRVICNVTGHPALALPMALAPNGMPLGIQIIGRKNQEDRLIALGVWIEKNVSTWTGAMRPALAEQNCALP